MNVNKKSKWAIYSLGALQVFIGLTAILGGFQLVLDPTGIKSSLSLEWLADSPFQDYFVPGLILVLVNGVGYTMGAAITFFRNRYAGDIAIGLGVCLIIYMVVEVWFVGLRNFLQPLYFILAIIVLFLGLKLHKPFETRLKYGWNLQ